MEFIDQTEDLGLDDFDELDADAELDAFIQEMSDLLEERDREIFLQPWSPKDYENFWYHVLHKIDTEAELSGLFYWDDVARQEVQEIYYRKFPDNPIDLMLENRSGNIKIRAIAKLPAVQELDHLVSETIGDPGDTSNEYLAFSIENEKPELWGFWHTIREMSTMLKALDENIYPILIEHAEAYL